MEVAPLWLLQDWRSDTRTLNQVDAGNGLLGKEAVLSLTSVGGAIADWDQLLQVQHRALASRHVHPQFLRWGLVFQHGKEAAVEL